MLVCVCKLVVYIVYGWRGFYMWLFNLLLSRRESGQNDIKAWKYPFINKIDVMP